MASATLINPNPIVYKKKSTRRHQSEKQLDEGDACREPIDDLEVFDHIRDITDPEHPYSLEQLNVVNQDHVEVDDEKGTVNNKQSSGDYCWTDGNQVDISVAEGSHTSEGAINKQLNDKERVTAALENPNLIDMVDKCLQGEHVI